MVYTKRITLIFVGSMLLALSLGVYVLSLSDSPSLKIITAQAGLLGAESLLLGWAVPRLRLRTMLVIIFVFSALLVMLVTMTSANSGFWFPLLLGVLSIATTWLIYRFSL